MIVEEEQAGENRAACGQQQLATLSRELTDGLGKGFGVSNLKNMRQFYRLFPIRYAVRSELSWTHYRTLMRVESTKAREWYVQEAINGNWITRTEHPQKVMQYATLNPANENRHKLDNNHLPSPNLYSLRSNKKDCGHLEKTQPWRIHQGLR